MSEISELLTSIFGFRARQGWILLLAGGLIVLGNARAVWPFDKIEQWWLVIAASAAILGAVILLISFVEWISSRAKAATSQHRANLDAKAKFEAGDRNAIENLEILPDYERDALVWVLRSGQQRFRAHRDGDGIAELGQKSIIGRPPYSTADDVFLVRPVVWAMRDELLKKWSNVRAMSDPPWYTRI